MSQKDPIIFGKQKLVFNSAKNKYDSDEENFLCNNSFNENESCDTAISNAIISRDSNSSNISQNNVNNNINIIINTNTQLNYSINSNSNKSTKSFLEENKKIPDVKKIYTNEQRNDLLSIHIKQALNQMQKEYFLNNINGNNNSYRNKYNYCEYFFSSDSYKIWENNDENL